jgi:hypothetical protein
MLTLHKKPPIRIYVEFKRLYGNVSIQSVAFLADATIDEALKV